jgi:hypothetical protein
VQGPRNYSLRFNLTDDAVTVPGPNISTIVTVNVTVVDVNDPPALRSANVTTVPENSALGTTVFSLVMVDEDPLDSIS